MATVVQQAKPIRVEPRESGVVRVQVTVPAKVDRVWAALTQRGVVGNWFGDLSQDLAPDTEVRLDFGDADFFAIQNVVLQPPSRLFYSWRFLGTGPKDEITWELSSLPEGAAVTVNDFEPSRSKEAAQELSEGWIDFLERLQGFLVSGKITRYDWRRSFDGSIELPISREAAANILFAPQAQPKWLPFGYLAGDRANDSAEERAVYAAWNGCCEVLCQVQAPRWARTTDCLLKITSSATGSTLTIRHTGWEEISQDPLFCTQQRRKFGELWIKALQQAKHLVQSETRL